MSQREGQPPQGNKPISLHPLTPEQALTIALNTPLPDSKVAKKKAAAAKKARRKKG